MKNITDLRNSLFETIQMLKEGKIEVSQAKAISDIGQVIVNSAKVELDYVKAIDRPSCGTGFISEVKKLD